ncbi:hypothetical protein [Clostridium sp. C8-1-8]|uniref:hypothetical protein n=1 Tax=Clostridium sp. C8-1-8 TaxID=2698831 RepID=UPI00136F4580|nr:hypothetical protein [Clostridium sp. C8-1-8]
MQKVALLTVIHDPKGKNIDLCRKLVHKLDNLYSEKYVTISDETCPLYISLLEHDGFNVKRIKKNGAADARRRVVEFGLEGDDEFYHYCDFDRLLTWISGYKDELKAVVSEIPKTGYLILGRTDRAFFTHPLEWIETEKISNKIFSLEFGQEVDITAGSCGFSRISAEYINKYSKDKMTDGEWPMIVHRIAKLKVSYRTVEGLEYKDEANGSTNLVTSSDKLFVRLKLAYIISESARNTGK